MKGKMFDVIVIGAGPAGSAAAKGCAEQGFQTLIPEKRTSTGEHVLRHVVWPSS